MSLISLTPPASQQSTNIHIGSGIRLQLHSLVAELKTTESIVVLYDKGVQSIASDIIKTLPKAHRIEVASGDASKSLAEAQRIASAMLTLRCTRSTIIICVGGGMLTDLGGFVASIFMRGVPCVYVPTSLLCMADASIGGKTGVNLDNAKNIIGTIAHPIAVVIDSSLTNDLPIEQLREGLVEIVKIAAVADAKFFGWLEETIEKVLHRDPQAVQECIERAVALKIGIVEQDEKDTLARLILNFGHTVGHAIEAASQFRLSHGACVSMGMAIEMDIVGFADRQRVIALLQRIDMPVALPKTFSADQLWTLMHSDKKNTANSVRCAVPTTIGSAEVRTISEAAFRKHCS